MRLGLDQYESALIVDFLRRHCESLYKALAPGAKPRFDTILKVARALGVKLSAQVA